MPRGRRSWLRHCLCQPNPGEAGSRRASRTRPTCVRSSVSSGAHLSEIKAAETKAAVNDGADEIDMVINVGAVKDDDWGTVESDISAVVDAAGMAIVKVILEVSELTDEEITRACQAAERCGADFVKTSTGFSRHGATAEAVSLMRRTVGDRLGSKHLAAFVPPTTWRRC